MVDQDYICSPMRSLAHVVSFVFHPLFLAYWLILLTFWIDRFGYYIDGDQSIGAMFIMDFFLLVLFPMVGIAVLVGLKMISGFQMKKRQDRIGPLIIILTCYIWYFVNVNSSAVYPDSLRFVALGITISAGIAFFINNFSKVSLHTLGSGSLVVAVAILIMNRKDAGVSVDFLLVDGFRVSAIFVLLICVMIAGVVGTARLYLKAHNAEEVYGGYIIGALAQIVAFRLII